LWKPCPKFYRFLTRFLKNYRNVFCFTYYRHPNGISWGFYPNLAWNFDENAWKTWYFADIFAIFPAIFLSNGQKNVRYFFAIAIWKKIHAIHFFISCITSHQHCKIEWVLNKYACFKVITIHEFMTGININWRRTWVF
jgi:hypothetical protein